MPQRNKWFCNSIWKNIVWLQIVLSVATSNATRAQLMEFLTSFRMSTHLYITARKRLHHPNQELRVCLLAKIVFWRWLLWDTILYLTMVNVAYQILGTRSYLSDLTDSMAARKRHAWWFWSELACSQKVFVKTTGSSKQTELAGSVFGIPRCI